MEPEAVTEAEAAVAPVVIAVAVSAAVEHVATFADAEFVGGDHLARLRVHEGVDVRAVVLHHADVQDGTVFAAHVQAGGRSGSVRRRPLRPQQLRRSCQPAAARFP